MDTYAAPGGQEGPGGRPRCGVRARAFVLGGMDGRNDFQQARRARGRFGARSGGFVRCRARGGWGWEMERVEGVTCKVHRWRVVKVGAQVERFCEHGGRSGVTIPYWGCAACRRIGDRLPACLSVCPSRCSESPDGEGWPTRDPVTASSNVSFQALFLQRLDCDRVASSSESVEPTKGASLATRACMIVRST